MATRTWIGGAGDWNSTNTAAWSGGAIPGTGDTAVFDGTSGSGTVVVDSPNGAGVVTVQSITLGASAINLDFATNNNNVTLTAAPGLSFSGTGTRGLLAGTGTWTITVGSGGTAFTFGTMTNAGTVTLTGATWIINGTGGKAVNFGAQSFGAMTWGADATGMFLMTGGAGTVASLAITAPLAISLAGGTLTVTAAPTWTGTSADKIWIETANNNATKTTIAISSGAPSLDWTVLRGLLFTGSVGTATNSIAHNVSTDITITAPSSGAGGARVIGG